MSAAEKSPKVSVLMPTYNYARYLPLAIESVLAQNYDDFELIVSDDASSDDSVQIALRYAAMDRRIRVHRHPSNLGMVANWNWCLAQARGRYVKFLFGDDALALADALRSLVELLDRHPSAVLAASARQLIDDRSLPAGLWDDLWPGVHAGRSLSARCLRRRRNLIGEPSSVLFRRAAAGRGFDPAYRQIVDLEMWLHLLQQGDLAYMARPLAAFRRHPHQQTEVNNRHRVTDHEMTALVGRYVQSGRLNDQFRPGSFAHRLILFRQLYYLRKARQRPKDTAAVERELRRQLPWRGWVACWCWHRATRPLVNLARTLDRLANTPAHRDGAICVDFFSGLPAWSNRPASATLDRDAAWSGPPPRGTWLEELAAAFQRPIPRGVAFVLLGVGLAAAAGLFVERHWLPRPPFPSLARAAAFPPDRAPPPGPGSSLEPGQGHGLR